MGLHAQPTDPSIPRESERSKRAVREPPLRLFTDIAKKDPALNSPAPASYRIVFPFPYQYGVAYLQSVAISPSPNAKGVSQGKIASCKYESSLSPLLGTLWERTR